MAQVNFSIIGLDKLGASLGLALRALSKRPGASHQFTVTGYDVVSKVADAALKMGAIDRVERAISGAAQTADLVFVAVPFKDAEKTLQELGAALKPGAVVMDASPLKLPPIQWAKTHFARRPGGEAEAYLVGVTPIIGYERVGDHHSTLEAASTDVFSGAVMLISPAADCPEEAVQLVADFSSMLGIASHFVDPAEHDGIAAAMEGLPLVLQLALFRTLSASPAWDDLRWMGNTSFFLGTYQLGNRDPESHGKLIAGARQSVLHRLDAVIDTLGELRDLIRSADELTVSEVFDDADMKYRAWERARATNEWVPQVEAPPATASFRPFNNLLNLGRKKKE